MRHNKLRIAIEDQHLLPGSMFIPFSVSKSTLRRWEEKGWIRDAGTAESTRLVWLILTRKGYMEA